MIDFELNESQKMILSSLENSLSENFDIRRENKKAEGFEYSNHGWEEIKRLGFLGILSNEENGGFGLEFFDFSLTLEYWGAKLCEGPYIENSIFIFILEKLKNKETNYLIKELSSSKKIVTSIISEQFINNEKIPVIHKRNNKYCVEGKITNLPYWNESTEVLTLASLNNEKKLLMLSKKNIDVVNESKTLTGQKLHEIKIDNLEISEDNIFKNDKLDLIDIYTQLFTISKCAESVGIADSIHKMTNEFIKTREQFNKPLGSFQAIQHMASDIYMRLSETRELIRYCSKLSPENENVKKIVSLSKIKCDEELTKIAWTAHQLHGAMGFTWDYGLHLMTKRILLNKTLNGDILFHSKKLFS
jgi:alkylation response protein AidB-like acyl-CoA dehydrogenase